MKELTIEQKAKRYDEALEKIHQFIDGYSRRVISKEELEDIFPELKESEDERIRKEIRDFICWATDGGSITKEQMEKSNLWLSWLEKQGEQKSLGFNIGDEITVNGQICKVVAVEQKPDEWEPQTGDTFRKKGTTSPTYHLCNKRDDGITFGFVENREVGIAGGEITIFALKDNYELVERPKSIEDVVEEELNRALQTKVEQNPAWSEEDETKLNDAIDACKAQYGNMSYTADWLKTIKDRVQPKQEWNEEDIMRIDNLIAILENRGYPDYVEYLEKLKDRVLPQPKQEWSEEDESMHTRCIGILGKCYMGELPTKVEKELDWLKSLGPNH
jgi:hypothetical protein